LRQANVLGLKWSDVDMDRRTAWVHADEPDAWKAYMRRATNTINYNRDLPLAQGIRFEGLTIPEPTTSGLKPG
jgi:integrase